MTQARFIRVFYPPSLGNWVKDGCLANLSTMTVNSRTPVELEGRSNPPPLTPALPAKMEGVSLELPGTTTREQVDYLSGNETNRKQSWEQQRDRQIHHVTWGPRTVLVLDLAGQTWEYCWTSQSREWRNSCPTHSLWSELELYHLKMKVFRQLCVQYCKKILVSTFQGKNANMFWG